MPVDMPRKSRLELPPLELGPESFGERLARLRKERGYTQTELAERIGIIQELVSGYERDKLRLHADLIVRFARALDVSADGLLGMVATTERSDALPPSIRRRMERITTLKSNEQKALLKTIDNFLKAAQR